MSRFNLQGTPSLLLFDRFGQLRLNHFGAVYDLTLGVTIATLLHENQNRRKHGSSTKESGDNRRC